MLPKEEEVDTLSLNIVFAFTASVVGSDYSSVYGIGKTKVSDMFETLSKRYLVEQKERVLREGFEGIFLEIQNEVWASLPQAVSPATRLRVSLGALFLLA